MAASASTAAGLRMRMGQPSSPVLIDAADAARQPSRGGAMDGTFAGGDAVIGRVPLQAQRRGGRNGGSASGDMTIDGGLTVSHLADPPKFYPLRSDNVHFTLANGR